MLHNVNEELLHKNFALKEKITEHEETILTHDCEVTRINLEHQNILDKTNKKFILKKN